MNISKYILVASLAASFLISCQTHACITSESESNNTESNANNGMCSDTLIEGNLSRNDVDWFTFDVTEAGTIDISLAHHRRDDFDWILYPTSGNSVASGETGNSPETGSYYAPSAGTYYLKLTRYSGQGWYDLTVNYPEGSGNPPSGDCGYGSRPNKPGGLTSYLTGESNDSCASLTEDNGAVLLMGGGSDVDQAFSSRVAGHVGTGKDVVILRTSGSDGYNDYLSGLMTADSVETLMVTTTSKANEDYVEWAIRSAEFVFLAGGDQSDYLNQWQGTKVQSALQHVFDKGGVIGGTSAGMAFLAASIYDPDGISGAVSDEVVTDFCHNTLNFSAGVISIPFLAESLTDTHFAERDRMGRAAVSLAHHSSNYFVIAADEATSIFVTSDGNGVVDGAGSIYVLKETSSTQRAQLSCGQAVEYINIQRVRLQSGNFYNFNIHTHNGSNASLSIDGNHSNFYTPTNPY